MLENISYFLCYFGILTLLDYSRGKLENSWWC